MSLCIHCGNEFKPSGAHKTCGIKCSIENWPKKGREKVRRRKVADLAHVMRLCPEYGSENQLRILWQSRCRHIHSITRAGWVVCLSDLLQFSQREAFDLAEHYLPILPFHRRRARRSEIHDCRDYSSCCGHHFGSSYCRPDSHVASLLRREVSFRCASCKKAL